jgi:AcrR family transcriptional regulator
VATKGELTRQAILEKGMALVSQQGLEAVSIGQLAAELDLSKSGLFAHFRSKEALQVQILEHAEARFVELVLKPALASPRGAPRLRALYERWMRWPEDSRLPGGCVFMATIFELDDRPGPARDKLAGQQAQFLATIATIVRSGMREGHFAKSIDPDQVAFELEGIVMAHYHAARLLRDRRSRARADAAFEALLARIQEAGDHRS